MGNFIEVITLLQLPFGLLFSIIHYKFAWPETYLLHLYLIFHFFFLEVEDEDSKNQGIVLVSVFIQFSVLWYQISGYANDNSLKINLNKFHIYLINSDGNCKKLSGFQERGCQKCPNLVTDIFWDFQWQGCLESSSPFGTFLQK